MRSPESCGERAGGAHEEGPFRAGRDHGRCLDTGDLLSVVFPVLFRKTFSARAVASVKASALPWRAEGLVVLVDHGQGTLRWTTGTSGPEGTRRSLVVGETPLVIAQTDEYWCPTCEKLLALGMGRESVEPKILEALQQVSNRTDVPVASAVGDISPLLQLMEDGVYLVSRVPYFPTNGEGLPFWALSRCLRRLKASRDWYFSDLGLFRLAQGYPAFLLSTQELRRCNWDRVEEYREQIRSGQRIGGLAFWVEGFLSALLDGHHRATACLLEGVPFTCLTVMSLGAVEIREGNKALLVWDERIPFAELPKEAVRFLEAQPKRLTIAESMPELPGGGAADEPWTADPHWDELHRAASPFPDALAVAALEIVGDTSDERIERLFCGEEHGAPELWLVFRALIASKDPRAVKLALRIGRAHWPDLWDDAFRFLTTVRTQEVEDFFIDFVVHDEGQHPWLEKVANEYLAEATT